MKKLKTKNKPICGVNILCNESVRNSEVLLVSCLKFGVIGANSCALILSRSPPEVGGPSDASLWNALVTDNRFSWMGSRPEAETSFSLSCKSAEQCSIAFGILHWEGAPISWAGGRSPTTEKNTAN